MDFRCRYSARIRQVLQSSKIWETRPLIYQQAPLRMAARLLLVPGTMSDFIWTRLKLRCKEMLRAERILRRIHLGQAYFLEYGTLVDG